MGVAISRYTELSSNELLAKFCSSEVICPNEPFWNQMLSFNITPPVTAEEQLVFDSSTEALLQQFLQTNLQTGNLGALVHVFITRATELLATPDTDNVMLAWQTFNALFVIRSVSKYLVEIVPEYELCRHMDTQPARRSAHPAQTPASSSSGEDGSPPSTGGGDGGGGVAGGGGGGGGSAGGESRVEMLLDALIGIIIDVPLTDNTYYLHVECVNTMLVLMSVYMFSGTHGHTTLVDTSLIFRTLYSGRYGMLAPSLVRTLLSHLAALEPAPPHMFRTHAPHGSVLIDIATGLWSMLSFGAPSRPSLLSSPPAPPAPRAELLARLHQSHPLANQATLLLLVLTNHCITPEPALYRLALQQANNRDAGSGSPQQEAVEAASEVSPPRIDMPALHNALCATAGCEHTTLLLYLLLHSCPAYRQHVSQTEDIERLIVPLLAVLYHAEECTSHHMYMSLICILLLTEDEPLIRRVHQRRLHHPAWYTERSLSEISLGGLMVLVLVRALQYNMVRVRDKYLHTNYLAAIANMSCEFRNLHPYVAQRLVSLLETLSKRRARLAQGDSAAVPHTHPDGEDALEHIAVVEEVIRMVLEIINSCVSRQLQQNTNLVYALLHKRHLFDQYTHLPVTQNIQMVIGYFSTRLQRVQERAGGELGVAEVLAAVRKGADTWSGDRLKKFPDLKFRYVEEERPEEFFTPYVWALVTSCGTVHWASEGGARAVRHLLAA